MQPQNESMLQEQTVHFCVYTAEGKHFKLFTQQQDIFPAELLEH